MRERLEYWIVWLSVKTIGLLPRPLARATGIGLGLIVYVLHARLRQVGMRNLALAFPGTNQSDRRRIIRGTYISLGRQLAEVCLFPRYTRESVSQVVVYEAHGNCPPSLIRCKATR